MGKKEGRVNSKGKKGKRRRNHSTKKSNF